MAYTFKKPSTNLKLRKQPEPEKAEVSTPAEKPEEYGIRLDHWRQMQHAINNALLPHAQARTDVIAAIKELQDRLGVPL